MKESEIRKLKSIEILKKYDVPYIENLSEIENTQSSFKRDPREVSIM